MDKVNSTKQAAENVQGKAYEELFDFFSQEHGLTLLYSQMDDIIHAVDNFKNRYNGDIEPQHKVTEESKWQQSQQQSKNKSMNNLQEQEQPEEIKDGWIRVETDLPPECTVVLGYNKKWIDEDYEPEGIRECFYNNGDWSSAVWNNEQDCWDTDWVTKPSHWMQRPQPPNN